MQGAEVTADLVSPLYDESLSAPSAQPNVTIQGSHKDMTNLFQFKSWRHRFEPATVLLNTNLDQHKTADVTQPKGSAADKHKFFDGSSSSESDSIDDPLHPGEAEQSLVDGLAIKESEMEQWAQSNPQMSRLYKGMTRSRGQHLAAQKDRMCTASRVHLAHACCWGCMSRRSKKNPSISSTGSATTSTSMARYPQRAVLPHQRRWLPGGTWKPVRAECRAGAQHDSRHPDRRQKSSWRAASSPRSVCQHGPARRTVHASGLLIRCSCTVNVVGFHSSTSPSHREYSSTIRQGCCLRVAGSQARTSEDRARATDY